MNLELVHSLESMVLVNAEDGRWSVQENRTQKPGYTLVIN